MTQEAQTNCVTVCQVCSFKIIREQIGKPKGFSYRDILRGIFIFKIKINVILPQSLCFAIIVPLNSEF